jgi:hypothetical protein
VWIASINGWGYGEYTPPNSKSRLNNVQVDMRLRAVAHEISFRLLCEQEWHDKRGREKKSDGLQLDGKTVGCGCAVATSKCRGSRRLKYLPFIAFIFILQPWQALTQGLYHATINWVADFFFYLARLRHSAAGRVFSHSSSSSADIHKKESVATVDRPRPCMTKPGLLRELTRDFSFCFSFLYSQSRRPPD